MKKLLSLVLAIALVLTSMSVAFASSTAPAKDIADSDIKAAVERLAALGIVAGKEDGKFHENDTLTRDEFAKMLVASLGLDSAAQVAKGTTRFSDVPSTRWSSGYINVAVSKGLVMGRPNGTFGPMDTVTYPEAITMLVRALGYKDAWLEGPWPSNMINAADEVGILGDVAIGEGAATRGAAAMLLNNALSCELVMAEGFGKDTTYAIQHNKTILSEKLGVTEVDDAVIVDQVPVSSDLDAGQIKLAGDATKYNVKEEGLDVDSLLGKEVTYLRKDKNILYVKVETADSDVVTGTIITNKGSGKYTVRKPDGTKKDYTFVSSPEIYINNNSGMTTADFTASLVSNKLLYGTFVLNDDGKARFANLYSWEGINSPILVTSVDTAHEFFKGYRKDTKTSVKVDLTKEDGYKVFGAVSALDDITANDVAYVATGVNNAGDAYTYVYVVRNTVTGEFTRVASDGSTVTIGGKAYNVDTAQTTISLNSNKDIKSVDSPADISSDIIGETVTAYLDAKGEVRHIESTAVSQAVIYGVVTKNLFYGSNGDKLTKIYVPAEDANVVYTNPDYSVSDGDAVMFNVDSDNTISALAFVNGGASSSASDINAVVDGATYAEVANVTAFDDTYNSVTLNSVVGTAASKLYVTADTLIVKEPSDPSVVTWDSIKSKTPGTLQVRVIADGKVAKLIVLSANYSGLTSSYKVAVVTDRYYDGSQRATLQIVGGDSTTYKLTSNAVSVKEGDVIIYNVNGDGKVDLVTRAVYDDVYNTSGNGLGGTNFGVIAGQVTSYENNILEFTNATHTGSLTDTDYVLGSDVEVYLLTLDGTDYDTIAKVDTSEIVTEDNIRIIVNKDNEVVAVIIVR